jgi:hypothetical protein
MVPAPVAGAIVHVTPSSAVSLVTEAVSVDVEPATTDVGLFAITTLTAFEAVEWPLHPATANTHSKAAIQIPHFSLLFGIYRLLEFFVIASHQIPGPNRGAGTALGSGAAALAPPAMRKRRNPRRVNSTAAEAHVNWQAFQYKQLAARFELHDARPSP